MRRSWIHSRHLTLLACAVLLIAAACGDAPEPAQNEVAADSATADSADVSDPGLEAAPQGLPPASDPNRPAGSLGDPADAQQVGARLSEWAIELSPATVTAGEITLNLTNAGERAHTIEIRSATQGRWRSAPIPPGGVVGMSMPLAAGTYDVVSTTPEYATRGMKATLVVR
ncbi:MAG: hypothetical protein L0271_06630 [Gemmatimonadetes bacterium]|nr:hypothetical protein [Gemmatimonadota bacterium]